MMSWEQKLNIQTLTSNQTQNFERVAEDKDKHLLIVESCSAPVFQASQNEVLGSSQKVG